MRLSVLNDEQALFLHDEKEALAEIRLALCQPGCPARCAGDLCRKPFCNWMSSS